jgi:hypothetical protein
LLRETGAAALHSATAVREPQRPTAGVSVERIRALRAILDGSVANG